MTQQQSSRSFESLVAEASAVEARWDFSWLDGRAVEERPSWRFFDLVAARAATVGSLLELDVGTGTMLGALPVVPAVAVGAEAHRPVVAAAGERLRHRGASLVVVPSAPGDALPLRSATFDLVTARHPVANPWEEVARVLRPGGTYLSQQVGHHTMAELVEAVTGEAPTGRGRHPDTLRAGAEAAGLEVVELREERPRTAFFDIGAVVYLLRVVVWLVPGFTADAHLDRLRAIHEHIERTGSFEARAARTLLEVRRPSA